MRVKQFGLAALFAMAGAAAAIGVAPIAVADDCDPTAAVCQGPDVQTDSPLDFAPAPAPDPDAGGAPGEMQLTDENPGIASPEHR
jgi:hypothetical protein